MNDPSQPCKARGLPFRSAWWLVVFLAVALVARHADAHAGPAPDATGSSSGPDGELTQPRLRNEVALEYPPELLELDPPPAGEVIVKFVVGTDGVPKELEVIQSVHPELDELAREAVSKLRYEPGSWRGEPVEVVMRIALQITPPQPAPEPEPEPEPDPSKPPTPADPGATDTPPTAPDAGATEEADREPIRIEGALLEAGQRTPIQGATILAIPAPAGAEPGRIRKKIYEAPREPKWQVKATTDDQGRFELRGVPDGQVRIVVLTQGYRRLEFVERLPPGEQIELRYYQTPLNTNPYRTVVRTDRNEREEVARRTITKEEINSIPGTQGDALKSIQNFPGMARSPFGIGLLLIRGAAPDDSAVYLGYHEIPQLFHFGGITSVFNSDILTEIDFIPGNFDSRYGDAIGGVVSVSPRKGRRDGYHGYVDSDVFDTGVLFEGPVGEGSFVLSARRSYIDLLLPAVIPEDAGLDATIAPRYWDYQALFDYPVAGGNLSVRIFGSDDRTKLVFSDENDMETDDRNRFETTVFFHRADLVYKKREGDWEYLITPSYRNDFFEVGAGDVFRFNVVSHLFSGRAEIGHWLTKRIGWRIGTEVLAGQFTLDAQAPPVPGEQGGSTDERLGTDTKIPFAIPALYTTWTIGLGDRFTLYPGVRFSYYTAPASRATVDPRLRGAWRVAERTTIKAGAGLYSQAPSIIEWNQTWGNPQIAPERSLHTSFGVAQEFDYALSLEVTGFYKYLWDMAETSEEIVRRSDGAIGPEAFASTGTGRIYGAELLARKDITGNLFGWISYTLMRSERKARPGDDFILFDFDQTHILTLIGVYKLPKHWQIGARFRLVSGNPETPVIGAVYDASAGAYNPIEGRENSDRLPMFHQLDIRVDKRWIWRKMMMTLYLDIQNVYNQQNTEFYNYSFDFKERRVIASLPIIPSLGFKLEF